MTQSMGKPVLYSGAIEIGGQPLPIFVVIEVIERGVDSSRTPLRQACGLKSAPR